MIENLKKTPLIFLGFYKEKKSINNLKSEDTPSPPQEKKKKEKDFPFHDWMLSKYLPFQWITDILPLQMTVLFSVFGETEKWKFNKQATNKPPEWRNECII